MIEKDVKMISMKSLPKMQISDELDAQIDECIKVSELSKADVVRQALRIGLPQIAAKFRPLRSGSRTASVNPLPNLPSLSPRRDSRKT